MTENPFTYTKKQFGGFRAKGREVMRAEAERLLDLLEGSIEDRATSDVETEVADALGVVEDGENLVVTVVQDRVGDGESSNRILKAMEYGSKERPMTKPVFHALKAFEG